MAAEDFIITNKRKKYKFARFAELANCWEAEEWLQSQQHQEFVRSRRRIIEVGAGTGYFLVEQARRQPEAFFVAIDVKADRLYAGARLAAEEGLTNVCFVRSNAERLDEVLGAGSIDEMWLTFSDPYPKKRQAKHRMTHPRFLAVYQRLLKSGGILHFKTDNLPLFLWSLEQLVTARVRMSGLTFDLHASNFSAEHKIMTTYEGRFHAEGLPIYAVDGVFFDANC